MFIRDMEYIFQEGIFLLMIRLTARVSGRVQMVGYRARVVDLARSLGLVGFVQNLPDGRVEVVAEGEKSDLGRFASALKMENSLIRVDDVETAYSEATGSFPGFRKVIDPEELGDRLDEGVGILKEILVTVKEGFGDLGEKMDTMLEKQDAMLEKQDAMLEKQDSTLGEIQGLRFDMKSYMNQRFERIETDLAELKAAMRERGII
jgi:acylphosphatase